MRVSDHNKVIVDMIIPHLQRVNHRVALYMRADESILEKPNPYDDGQGRIRTEDGVLEPVWSWDAALPNLLDELLDTGDREEEEEEEEENEEGRGKRERTSLTLTISVKAIVNDDLTLIA